MDTQVQPSNRPGTRAPTDTVMTKNRIANARPQNTPIMAATRIVPAIVRPI